MTFLVTNPDNRTDGGTLELDGADSIASADVGGFTYVFVAGGVDDGVSVFKLLANGTLTPVIDVTDNAILKLDGATGLSTAMVDGNTYLFVAGVQDSGVSVFRVGTDGSLTNTGNVTDDGTMFLSGVTDTATARVGGNTYLFTAGTADDGISVFKVAGNGTLTNIGNTADTVTLKLDGVDALTTVTVGGTSFLIAAGGVDDGISVFSIAANGALTSTNNFSDNATLNLNGASDITSAVIGAVTYVFVAGAADNGISVFTLNSTGILTNVFNFTDTVDTLVAGATSLSISTIGTSTYLLVGGTENGLSMFRVETGSNSNYAAGSLTFVDNIADQGSRELSGTVSTAGASVGGTNYFLGAGATDDGVSSFRSTATGQLYFFGQGGGADARLAYVNNDGGNQTSFVDDSPTTDLVTTFPEELGVDTAAGFYFALDNGGNDGSGSRLVRGSLSGGLVTTLVTYDGVNNVVGDLDDEIVNALHVDVINHKVYLGIQDPEGDGPGATGIFVYDYSPTTGAISNGHFLTTVTSSGKPQESGFDILDVRDFDVDPNTHLLFFTELLTGGVSANGLFRLDINSPNVILQLVPQAQFPDNGSNGYITDVEVDNTTGIVYFDVESQHAFPNAGYVAGQNNIYWISETANGSTNATLLTLNGLPGGGHFYPGDMVFDQGTRQLYVESEETDDGSGADTDDVVYVFQLSMDGHSATLINTISLVPPVTNIAANIGGMIFNDIPLLASVTGTATHVGEQGGVVQLLTGAPTITDADGDHLSSATVQVTQGLFSSNDSNASDDRLFFGTTLAASGTVAGTNISWAYNSATNTLTFTGYDTLANYQTAFAGVRFQSLGDNPTNFGLDTTRTITWTVSDGAVGVPGGSQNSATTSITIDAVNDGPTNNNVPASVTTPEDTPKAITGLSVTDPDANPAITNVTVTMSVTNGTLTLLTNVTGGLIASQITGNGTNSVTITAPLNDINATLASATGLTYTNIADYNGSDTLHIVTNDGGNTGSGGAKTDTDDIAITVTAVQDIANDTVTVAEDSGANSLNSGGNNILTNDSFENSGRTITLAGPASHGTVTINDNGNGPGSDDFVVYTPTGNYNGSDSFSYTVTSGGVTETATVTVTVTAVNDPVTNTTPNSGTVNEDVSAAVTGMSIADVDATLAPAGVYEVTLSALHGTLTLTTLTGLTFTGGSDGTADATMTFHGTLANINNALATASYLSNLNYNGSETITLSSTDTFAGTVATGTGAATNDSHSYIFTVNPVNDAPVVGLVGAQTPAGAETRANTTTAGDQLYSSVAGLSGGGHVVVWQSPDASGSGVYMQRYDANGAVLGIETRINTTTAGDQLGPSVTALNGGGYVVTWTSVGQDLSSGGIYMQRYDGSGVAQGVETRVNTVTAGNQQEPSVSALADGGYVVIWMGPDAAGNGIFGQRYNSAGVAQGGEFAVNNVTTGEQQLPAVTGLTGGGFAVTWFTDSDDGSGQSILVRRYDAAGVAQGNAVRANTFTTGDQSYPGIGATSDGGYVVAWESLNQDGSGYGVYAQRYNSSGATVGTEFRVNATIANSQEVPVVTGLDNGGFVVSWRSFSQDGDDYGVYAQRYDASGVAVGAETRVNTFTTGSQANPAIDALAGGGFVISWHSLGQDGGGWGIYEQRFADGFVATEQVAASLKNSIMVSDVDAGAAVVTATLSVGYGVINVGAGGSGATVSSGNGTGSVVVTGTIAQINALLSSDATSTVTFTANTDTPPASTTLTVTVNDGGATGADPGLSGDANSEQGAISVPIQILSVNDAPQGADAAYAFDEEGSRTLSQTDFGFSDPAEGNGFAGVVITSLPTNGVLLLNGVPVTIAGTFVTAAQISGNQLVFKSDADENGSPYATLTFQVRDDGGTLNGGQDTDQSFNTLTFNVNSVNDAPTQTGIGGDAATWTENNPPVALDVGGNGIISDVDSPNFDGGTLTVLISGGVVAEDGLFILSTGNGIAAGGNPVDGFAVTFNGIQIATFTGGGTGGGNIVFTFNSDATVAAVNALVSTLAFATDDGSGEYPTPGLRNITWTLVDGDGVANSGHDTLIFGSTVNVVALNDTPAVSLNNSNVSTEQVAAALDLGASVHDNDLDARNGLNGDYSGSTLTIANNGGNNANDLFGLVSSGGFTVSGGNLQAGGFTFATFTGGNGTPLVITFTSSGTAATTALVNDVIKAVQYTYTGDTPPASIDVIVSMNDGAPGNANQGSTAGNPAVGSDIIHINITNTPEDAAPVIDLNGVAVGIDNTASYTENAAPVILAGGLAVTDADDTNIEGATVSVGAGFIANADYLTVNGATNGTMSGISFNYVAATGILTLTGTATLAAYQAVLAQVGFESTSDNPGASRTITWTVTDGDLPSAAAHTVITVTPQNDAPVAQPDALTTDEATAISGSVFADHGSGVDNDVDGPALAVAEVNGLAANVGVQITLASGAHLTLNANGTFSYDPNHVFDDLPAEGSGASNLTDTDSFTYTLAGGSGPVMVTVTLSGLDSDDTLLGTAGSDTLIGGTGVDTMSAGAGDDNYYVDNFGDVVNELPGEGRDVVYAGVSYALGTGSSVEVLATDNLTATTAFNLAGNELDNVITGNAGANILIGGGGEDALYGLGGDDTYYVDGLDDSEFELPGGGTDVVYTSGSHALAAGSAIEFLSAADLSATTAFNLAGNELDNVIIGNAGANILIGGGGADYLAGGGGNDTYYVDSVDDRAVETAGGGSDVVYASSSYALAAGSEVEYLSAVDLSATTALNLAGNELNNIIYGNAGSNLLIGGGGTDFMAGGAGDDIYYVDSSDDRVSEELGQGSDVVYTSASFTLEAGSEVETLAAVDPSVSTALDLTGNALGNGLYGNAGANVLNGGGGADYLFGGGGADTFQFTSALGGGNVATIGDFVSGTDKLVLDDAVFGGLGLGSVPATVFHVGASATAEDQRLIYDDATGNLYYDADGSGAGAQVLFATLSGHPALTAGDFQVI